MDNHLKGLEGESFVTELATKTFLAYWCFPNPYDELGDKKEICDLLILFKDCCIICQVKNYEFKNDHGRYFRKTVNSAAKQIQGAKRKLFNSKRDISIKHNTRGLIRFDRDKYCKIIRLVIHLGNGIQYQHIGQLTEKEQAFIHIIGKEDFEYLLAELNTIADLVTYLQAREALATKIEKVAFWGKEKDLLGFYLQIQPHFEQFIKDNEGKYLLLDGEESWEDFLAKKTDNENLLLEVETLIYDWVKSDLILNECSISVAEDLMSLNRKERRLFSISLLRFIDTYLHKGNNIIRSHIVLNQIGFVFFYYPEGITEKRVEQLMFVAAEGFSYYTNHEITKMIVIGISENTKIKFTLADFTTHQHFKIDELEMLLDYLGWFKEDRLTHWNIDVNGSKKKV